MSFSHVIAEVEAELSRVLSRCAPLNSPHEGHSIIREELDELWEHVRADTGRSVEARREAVQIATTAIRYAAQLCQEDA